MRLQRPCKGVVAPVGISHEQLVFTQSDMDASNFGVDDKGNACLFDFGKVGLLPESFASYSMSSNAPFTVQVAKYLGWPSCPNLESMSKIFGDLRCVVIVIASSFSFFRSIYETNLSHIYEMQGGHDNSMLPQKFPPVIKPPTPYCSSRNPSA
ncbi:hypothetical protein EDD16DRAFT_560781 [Pisolithus croceorrhizus]|nr:hypothetical protein EDD16DRAFT_560781 [Pisolithus croceorrhizus]KAI6115386.1 hypothetical protein EV401DRAFT_75647 [Pisolithus croceorrhizus]